MACRKATPTTKKCGVILSRVEKRPPKGINSYFLFEGVAKKKRERKRKKKKGVKQPTKRKARTKRCNQKERTKQTDQCKTRGKL